MKFYAWTTRLPDGGLSLVGTIAQGLHMPLVSMNRGHVDNPRIRAIVESHCIATGQTATLDVFDYQQTIDTVEPD